MDTDRARACLFGLALGDALAASLLREPGRPLSSPDALRVTNYTRIALATAELLRRGPVDPPPPRTPDDSSALLRVVPLAMCLSDEALVAAAAYPREAASAHPDAASAAIATALVLRALFDDAPFPYPPADLASLGPAPRIAAVLPRTRAKLDALGGSTAAVLSALDPSCHTNAGASPKDDAPRVLGAALAAVLAGGQDFADAIAAVAQRDGGLVAALAGALWGAATGMHALPISWLSALQGRERLGHVLDDLLPTAPTPSSFARTSTTDPIAVAWIPGTFGHRGGRLGLTFAPGKHAPSTLGTPWARDLSLDLHRLRSVHGVDALVSLVTDEELVWLRIPDLVTRAESVGIAVIRHPVEDGGIPVMADAQRTVATALSLARAGQRVVFHCRGGLGRAGTFTALTLQWAGFPPAACIACVRNARPGAIENAVQEDFLYSFVPSVSPSRAERLG